MYITFLMCLPLQMICCLRVTKRSWYTEFCTLVILLLQCNHRNVLKFPFFQFVLSVQESNNALSLSRLISKVFPYQHRPGVQISELVLMYVAGNGLTFHMHCCLLSCLFYTSLWHICSLLEEVWSQWSVLQC